MTSPSSRPSSIVGSSAQSPTPKFARLSAPTLPPSPAAETSATLQGEHAEQTDSHQQDLVDSQRRSFAPYFTLISDAASTATYHPRDVHYLFSDDDPELLTSACLDALHNPTSSESASSSKTKSSGSQEQRDRKPSYASIREHRVLLLDVDAAGKAITKARSLTPNWQILNTNISAAPTWDAAQDNAAQDVHTQSSNASMMLKIEGTGVGEIASRDDAAAHGLGLGLTEDGTMIGDDEFQSIMKDFDERMRVLRVVVGADDSIGLDSAAKGHNKSE